MYDLDAEILYWIEYFDYKWIDCGNLIDYIKENYVKEREDVVMEYVEAMEIKVPNLRVLDWDYICNNDNDYVELPGSKKMLNIHLLEDAELELQRNGLVR